MKTKSSVFTKLTVVLVMLLISALTIISPPALASAAPDPAPQAFAPLVVANGTVSLGISGQRGGAVDSFKVLGTEVVDVNDLGREIQASLTFAGSPFTFQCNGQTHNAGYTNNPQEAGDICGRTSPIYGLNLGPAGSYEINVGTTPLDWNTRGTIPGLRIEGNHKLGPLPYAPFREVTRLGYHIFSDRQTLTMQRASPLAGRQPYHPTPYLPAIYFQSAVLTDPWGLKVDGSGWERLRNVYTGTGYDPSLYRYRAVAWMKADLGWGVALYERATLSQTCPVRYVMADPAQQGQCPNFEVNRFTGAHGANNLSIVDQSITTIPAGSSVWRAAHLVVGNQQTMQSIINYMYANGN